MFKKMKFAALKWSIKKKKKKSETLSLNEIKHHRAIECKNIAKER